MAQPASPLPSDPHDLLEIACRRKWVVILPFLVVSGFATFLARALPSVYRSSTVILVEAPKVPEAYVKSTVTTRIEDRLATITQQISSRTRLESIIRQFDLYSEDRAKLPMDTVIERMRHAIEISVRGNNSFTIFYYGRNPLVVRDVTNALAAGFIEENSKVREEQAAGTSEFLESQLASLKQTLADQERKVREFKERYMGELPQQQEANLRALDRLQMQSQVVADQLRAAEDRRLLLQGQIAGLPRSVPTVTPSGRGPAGPTRPLLTPLQDPALARLEQARAALIDLQTRYTDQHPDVIRAKRQVEDLEALMAGRPTAVPAAAPSHVASSPTAPDGDGGDPASPVTADGVQHAPNPLYRQIDAPLAVADREIRELRASQQEITARVRALQRRVENVPRLEQQLLELTRDYDNTRRSYDGLLAKKLDAQLAENLERRQKGEQFRVLDSASLPQTPYKPNRPLILVAGLVLGLGVGAAAAAGLELLDPSIRSHGELKALAPQLPLIGTIPVIADPKQIRRRRLVTAGVGVLTLLVGTTAVVGAVRYQDRIVRLGVFEFLLR